MSPRIEGSENVTELTLFIDTLESTNIRVRFECNLALYRYLSEFIASAQAIFISRWMVTRYFGSRKMAPTCLFHALFFLGDDLFSADHV